VQVTIHAAKSQLSKLIEAALAGEDVVIARGAAPVVRIVPADWPIPVRRHEGSAEWCSA